MLDKRGESINPADDYGIQKINGPFFDNSLQKILKALASDAKGRLQNFIKIEYRKAFEKKSKAFLLHSIDMTRPV